MILCGARVRRNGSSVATQLYGFSTAKAQSQACGRQAIPVARATSSVLTL